jgi:hypothetical protein
MHVTADCVDYQDQECFSAQEDSGALFAENINIILWRIVTNAWALLYEPDDA